MASSQEKDLDKFLNAVNEIESIVKKLNSSDAEAVENAKNQADAMIEKLKEKKNSDENEDTDNLSSTKIGFNKSRINKYKPDEQFAFSPQDFNPPNNTGSSAEAFMAVMEEDARKRSQQRKQRWAEADIIKGLGNSQFNGGNYEAALALYNQAIDIMRDNEVLYTNRAQCHLKLGQFSEVLTDCEWAFKVNEKCIKAYILQGRAYLGLKDYDKARESYSKVVEIMPQKSVLIKEYLAEVNHQQQLESQELNAAQVFGTGNVDAQNIVELLERVKREGQPPLFYGGGFFVIGSLLHNTDQRTLFRTHGGIKISQEGHFLARCLKTSPKNLSTQELEMLKSAIDMYTLACTDCGINQEQFLAYNNIADCLLQFLEAKMNGSGQVLQHSLIRCFYTVSCTEYGRRIILTKADISRLIASVFTLMRTHTSIDIEAGNLLSNLCLEKKLQNHIQKDIEKKILPPFETLLNDESVSCSTVCSCLRTVMHLVGDQIIRQKVAEQKDVWRHCLSLLNKHHSSLGEPGRADLLQQVLALLIYLSIDVPSCAVEFADEICQICVHLWEVHSEHPHVTDLGLALLARLLSHCPTAVNWICESGKLAILLAGIKQVDNGSIQRSCMKCLATCSHHSKKAQHFIVNNKGLGPLIALLRSKDEQTVGNAALCLSHCTAVPKVCLALSKTDVVKELLALAQDQKLPQAQENCAILLAKLAKGHERNLQRLRELHGIEILHSCMKYIK